MQADARSGTVWPLPLSVGFKLEFGGSTDDGCELVVPVHSGGLPLPAAGSRPRHHDDDDDDGSRGWAGGGSPLGGASSSPQAAVRHGGSAAAGTRWHSLAGAPEGPAAAGVTRLEAGGGQGRGARQGAQRSRRCTGNDAFCSVGSEVVQSQACSRQQSDDDPFA
jgi:hypothetical protein